MIKVICVSDSPNRKGDKPPFSVGEELTASQCNVIPDAYVIHEYPMHPTEWGTTSFAKKRFIPLSEIDETTFERNYKKELV